MTYRMVRTALGFAALLWIAQPSAVQACPRLDGDGQHPSSQKQGSVTQSPVHYEITRADGKLSVSADHVDVQTLLQALFTRVDRQFTVDQTVSGTVTLRLVSLPFERVLSEICEQAHLIWRYNGATRLYKITWEPAALKGGYAMAQYLFANGAISGQDPSSLAALLPGNTDGIQEIKISGLPDTYLHDAATASSQAPHAAVPGLHAYFTPNEAARNSIPAQGTVPAGVIIGHVDQALTNTRQITQGMGGFGGYGGAAGYGAMRGRSAADSAGGPGGIPGGLQALLKAAPAQTSEATRRGTRAMTPPMPAGNLVYFQIPYERPMPAATLVHQLGIAAGIPVVADNSLSPQCVVAGRVSPRTLAKMLDALALFAKLKWVWTGDQVVVSALPVTPAPGADAAKAEQNTPPAAASPAVPRPPK